MNTDVYATESIAFNSNVSMLNPALQNLVGGGRVSLYATFDKYLNISWIYLKFNNKNILS
ncbi:hypothetical protein [Lactobacillus gasseri]|uniref:Uncharacterized protein n=1 Tax=Lactobacillus gasseri TaxID=1596 RepID=A0AB33ZXR6_LACGS|nr:hypothetical protein [Lactobacillus gasseri]GBA98150.1 hypothetical protein LJCM1025_18010 [Lactobacillus gasseri]